MNGAIKLTVALAAISAIVFSASIVFALNLEYRIETIPLKKFLLPNETIKLNVTLINRDVFSAKNTELKIIIGPRQYTYNIGDVKSSGIYNTVIELPQFPPGTYTIKGIANYTELFDQRFVTETFNSFEVKFPEIERFPRSVYVKEFNLPDNITAGKSYTARLKVSNEGDVPADLIVEVNSLNDTVNIPKHLDPGQSDTIELNITFTSSGTGIAEGRIFAVINNQKYFLGFLSKQIFVKEAKAAKIVFDRLELVNEPDNQLNRIDDAQIRIFIMNNGNDIAASVITYLESDNNKITISNPAIDYVAILPGESIGKDYEIKTDGVETDEVQFNIRTTYLDSLGEHIVQFNAPLIVYENPKIKLAEIKLQNYNFDVSKDGVLTLNVDIRNSGEAKASNVKGRLLPKIPGIKIINVLETFGDLDIGQSISKRFQISVEKVSTAKLDFEFVIEYTDQTGAHMVTYDIEFIGKEKNIGESCFADFECGSFRNEKMVCSERIDTDDKACCPLGKNWNGVSCVSKINLIVVPLNYDQGEYDEFKKDAMKQINWWIPRSPLKETKTPFERVNLYFLNIEDVKKKTDDCGELNNIALDSVLASHYRNTYDKIIGVAKTIEFGIGGCAYLGGPTAVTVRSYPEAMSQEIGHAFSLCHTKGCGAARGLFCPNDANSDGWGEIMDYCPGDEYYSYKTSDEYLILRNIFVDNGWL